VFSVFLFMRVVNIVGGKQLKGQALLAVTSSTPTGFRTPDSRIPAIPFSIFHVLGLPADIQ